MVVRMSASETPRHVRGSALDALFFAHPRQQNETYVEHFKAASKVALMSGVGAVFMMVHALVPGVNLFEAIGTYSTTYYGVIVDLLSRNAKMKN